VPDEFEKRIEELEAELADLKAVQGANEDLRKEAEEPYGLARLREVRRKETHPNEEETQE
jgi:DNA gyrase/topoisomerase IV subunit A